MAESNVLRMVVQLVLVLQPVVAYPNYIGCDLQVMPTKLGAGRNVMTTTGSIMGATPRNDANLVSASAAGSTVTLTFSGAFRMGIAHASIGTFTAPQFSGTPDANAATCGGTQSIKYKDVSGPTNSIVWQPPAQTGTAASVTFSFAGASGYGTIYRHTITLALSSATGTTATSPATLTTPPPTVTPPVTSGQYTKIRSGSCVSYQLDPIKDIAACQDAAQALQLASRNVTSTSATPLPEGCYYSGNRLYLAVNPANVGNGAAPSYEQLCAAKPATVAPTLAPTTTPNLVAGPSSGNVSVSGSAQFKLVTTGNCISNRLSTITDRPTCEAAAQALQMPDKTAIINADTPRPPGCYHLTVNNINGLFLSTNPANARYGASPGYELLCLNTASSVAGTSTTDNKVIIGGIGGGVLLLCLCLVMGCCVCRYKNSAKSFEA